MIDFPILTLTTFLPLVGALAILLIRGDEAVVARNARATALWTSLATFVVSIFLWVGFDNSTADFQFVEKVAWIPSFGLNYHMGVDGISVFFVILSTFLTPICILASWESIQHRVKEYMIAFLVLETLMVGMFCALDLILFYIFFEAVLIPMFLIIGIWGGGRRVYAAFKFFLYTLTGSVLMLIAILVIYFEVETTDIPTLLKTMLDPRTQLWLWLAFFASFAVKVPMWPVHTWLPDAHVEAPTAGSVILAGVLLKMGAYGFLRFSVPMLPYATDFFTPLIYTLSIIAIIYTSLVALAQEDMKKLIAYSSVAHMGYVTLGIFTFTKQGIEGSIFQMISHGLISAALFLCVGVVYDRLHSRMISTYGGLVNHLPKYSFLFIVFALAGLGLPGTSGFLGEFLVLAGAFQKNYLVSMLATFGVVLGAAYMLWLTKRVIFGNTNNNEIKNLKDINNLEALMLITLAILVILFGFYPSPLMDTLNISVDNLINNYEIAIRANGLN